MTRQNLEKLLHSKLNIDVIEVIDESHKHRGHHGHSGEEGTHFRCLIVSDDFQDKTLMERHQIIYGVLTGIMGQEIHALALKTLTSSEFSKIKVREA